MFLLYLCMEKCFCSRVGTLGTESAEIYFDPDLNLCYYKSNQKGKCNVDNVLFTQSERDDNESRQYPGRQRSLGADNMRDLAYLKLLSREYPNIRAAASDIINLQAICGLPKGTEYFFSDLHGEHEAFIYLLRSSSGIIREKIRETFGHIISEEDEVRLANLIYYPEKMINQIKQANEYTEDWQKTAVYRLVQICREVSSKYTRSKVRKRCRGNFRV